MELQQELTVLFRQEIELAKTELTEKGSKFLRNNLILISGGLIAYTGILFLLYGINVLLRYGLWNAGMDLEVATWLSPLIVGTVVCLIGYGFIQKSLSTLKHMSLFPNKFVKTLQEEQEWTRKKIQ